ncbi:hypothetical protein EMUR_01290 [Ehrlichia muris AS145]|uniref:Uncharacterized protein n=1 Tax=Ehrlichia muris AS145 TaxID=1423892 RepID=V9R7C1_9RICK|nr:hypothetical protein EMUR_01290 [Ehrlichia muris AS145]
MVDNIINDISITPIKSSELTKESIDWVCDILWTVCNIRVSTYLVLWIDS